MGRALIPGLAIVPDAITPEREAGLVAWIERIHPQSFGGRRRLDLYGDGPFVRTSGGRVVSGIIPPYLAQLALEIYGEGCTAITVSEYLPGQGVREHIDRPEAGPVIRTLALLSDADLVFRKQVGAPPGAQIFERFSVPFPQRSLMQMRDPCRSSPWTHELLPVAHRRMSIAFRGAVDRDN